MGVMAPIHEIARKLEIAPDDLFLYGPDMAKVKPIVRERPTSRTAVTMGCK